MKRGLAVEKVVLVLSTFQDLHSAEDIAKKLVKRRLCACATLTPVRSIYTWKGRLEDQKECSVIFKTTGRTKTRLMRELALVHPYEVPEILSIPAKDVSKSYLSWVVESTKGVAKNRDNSS